MQCPRMLAVIALAALALAIASPVVEFSRAAAFQTAASTNADAKTPPPDNTIRLHGLVEPIRSRLLTAPHITRSGPPAGMPPPQLVIVRPAKQRTLARK